jgi:hypothetical protein
MRRSWNFAFVLGRAARWCAALLFILPAGLLLGLALGALWLLWLAVSGLQAWLMRFGRGEPMSATALAPGPIARRLPGARVEIGPGPRRTLVLPPVERRDREPHRHPRRRHSVEDLRRSIEGMTRHGWPKAKVIEALEAAGAARLWSERSTSQTSSEPMREAERVHLRYRPGDTVFQRYTHPAARIEVYFDHSGRLVRGWAHQQRSKM